MNVTREGHWAPYRLSGAPLITSLLCGMVIMTACSLAPIPLMRASLVLPLALLLPGVALLACLVPRFLEDDPVPALALSALTSLAFYALASVALYALGVRLSTVSVLSATDILVVVAIAVLAQRSNEEGAAQSSEAGQAQETPRRSRLATMSGALLFLAGTVVSITLLCMALRALPASPTHSFVQFYVEGGTAQQASLVQVSAGQRVAVQVGLTNDALRARRFEITPTLSNGGGWPVTVVTLGPSQEWNGTIAGRAPRRPGTYRLALALRHGTTHPATLTVWVRVR